MMMERAIPHVFHSQYSAPQTPQRFNLTNPFTTVQLFQYYSQTLLPSPLAHDIITQNTIRNNIMYLHRGHSASRYGTSNVKGEGVDEKSNNK